MSDEDLLDEPDVVPEFRRGYDILPLPASREDWVWLRACLPVDHTARISAFKMAAAELMLAPAPVVVTDATRAIVEQVRLLDDAVLPILQSSGLLRNLDNAARGRLIRSLRQLAAERPLVWICVESDLELIDETMTSIDDGWVCQRKQGVTRDKGDQRRVLAVLLRDDAAISIAQGWLGRRHSRLELRC